MHDTFQVPNGFVSLIDYEVVHFAFIYAVVPCALGVWAVCHRTVSSEEAETFFKCGTGPGRSGLGGGLLTAICPKALLCRLPALFLRQ